MEDDKKTNNELLQKLEEYEQLAYDGHLGTDWLIEIGEGFKFYIKDCVNKNEKVTISGFEKYIDGKAKELLLLKQ
jgi:hypothetical protein